MGKFKLNAPIASKERVVVDVSATHIKLTYFCADLSKGRRSITIRWDVGYKDAQNDLVILDSGEAVIEGGGGVKAFMQAVTRGKKLRRELEDVAIAYIVQQGLAGDGTYEA